MSTDTHCGWLPATGYRGEGAGECGSMDDAARDYTLRHHMGGERLLAPLALRLLRLSRRRASRTETRARARFVTGIYHVDASLRLIDFDLLVLATGPRGRVS